MIIYPAMDLMNGEVVKLEARQHEKPEKIYGTPGQIASKWFGAGARWLHVVDLNAALGRGVPNHLALLTLLPLLSKHKARIQWGGGVRDATTLRLLLEARLDEGAIIDRVIVGTRAVNDWTWLETAVESYPNRIVVAADATGREVVVGGWQQKAGIDVIEFVEKVQELAIGAVLYTNVGVEGRGTGMEWPPVQDVIRVSKKPVIIAGGVTTLDDIRKLRDLGAHGAIIGSALYAGKLDLAKAIEAAGGV